MTFLKDFRRFFSHPDEVIVDGRIIPERIMILLLFASRGYIRIKNVTVVVIFRKSNRVQPAV